MRIGLFVTCLTDTLFPETADALAADGIRVTEADLAELHRGRWRDTISLMTAGSAARRAQNGYPAAV